MYVHIRARMYSTHKNTYICQFNSRFKCGHVPAALQFVRTWRNDMYISNAFSMMTNANILYNTVSASNVVIFT